MHSKWKWTIVLMLALVLHQSVLQDEFIPDERGEDILRMLYDDTFVPPYMQALRDRPTTLYMLGLQMLVLNGVFLLLIMYGIPCFALAAIRVSTTLVVRRYHQSVCAIDQPWAGCIWSNGWTVDSLEGRVQILNILLLFAFHHRFHRENSFPAPVHVPDSVEPTDVVNPPEEARRCRICLSDTEPVNFLAPCRCSGTNKWVHRSCLETWRLYGPVPGAFTGCSVCVFAYKVDGPLAIRFDQEAITINSTWNVVALAPILCELFHLVCHWSYTNNLYSLNEYQVVCVLMFLYRGLRVNRAGKVHDFGETGPEPLHLKSD